jgi:hypothetical protein
MCLDAQLHPVLIFSRRSISVTAVMLRPIISQVQNPFTVFIIGCVKSKSAADSVTSWKKLSSGQE